MQEADYYVAQCLEYDIAVQAKEIKLLQKALARAVFCHFAHSIEYGTAPFAHLTKAPKVYFDKFAAGVRAKKETKLNIPAKTQAKIPVRKRSSMPRVAQLAFI